jgi:hypothetical protein
VYYLPPSDASYTGDAAEIDIRNDLPAPASTPTPTPATTPPPGH